MRILQVSHNFHVTGGSDTVFLETSRLLEQAGHQVVPFCIASDKNARSPWSDYFPSAANSGAPSMKDAFRYFYNRDARAKLNRLLDASGPFDVAHLHIYHGKQTPAILPVLKRRGIAIVHSLHEYKLACPVYTLQRHGKKCELCVQGSSLNSVRHRCKDRSLIRSLVMAAESSAARLLGDVRLIDRFVCVSDFQREIMTRAGIPAHKLVTLHNFVRTADHEISHSNDGYLLYFGRIEKLKGIATLVDAVTETGQKLVIAGDGAYTPDLLARTAGLADVTHVGFQSGKNLADLIARAKAVVVPSEWYENCPMSLLEAKASGKPVVGARIGGIPELVRDGKDGFLFEAGDTRDLVRALRALEASDQAILSRAARQDAESRFSDKTHLEALTKIYSGARQPDFQTSEKPRFWQKLRVRGQPRFPRSEHWSGGHNEKPYK